MCSLLKVSFFTDIYGLKFYIQSLLWDCQSSGKLHILYRQFATDVSGQTSGLIFKGQVGQWW